jgi:hypothetical protein
MSNYHVSKDKDTGKWNIQKENAGRSSGTAETQKQAEQAAKQFAANSGGGEVRIHGLNGKIRDSDTVAPGNESSAKDSRH